MDLERGRQRADVADPPGVIEQRVEQAAGELVVLDPQQRLRHVVAAGQLPLALEPGGRLAQQRRALPRLAAQDEHGPERLADGAGGRPRHAGQERRRAARAGEGGARVAGRDRGAGGEREGVGAAVGVALRDLVGDRRVALGGHRDRSQPRLEHRVLEGDLVVQRDVLRERRRVREQLARVRGAPREPAGLRRRDEPLGALGRGRGELGGALVCVGRGEVARALREAPGGGGQRLGHRLVGRDGGGGEMPGAPLARGAVRGLQRGGERGVRAAPLLGARSVVHERAQQRMAEAQPVLGGGDRARALGLGERAGRQAEPARGVVDHVRVLGFARGGEHERAPRGTGKLVEAALERVRDQPPRRQRLAEPDAAGEPVVADGGGDLQRGERVAVGRARDARDEVAGERPLGRAGDQRRDRVLLQAAERQPLEARQAEARRDLVAEGDEERDPSDPACREPSASIEALSIHCASSTHASTGASAAAATSRPSTAAETAKRSTGSSDIASAPRSAPACGGGSSSISPSTGCSSSWIPENGSSASCSAPSARRRRMPPARAATASSSADFPTPGSPVSTRTPPSPARAPANTASMRSSSASRPTSTARAYLCSGPVR